MNKAKQRKISLVKRHQRIRKTLSGTAERPRISVFRSLKHLYVQLIDDVAGNTLASISTKSKEFGITEKETNNNIEAAKKLGALLSEKAKEKKISKVVFDRSGYRFHGRIKALADAARAGGLEF